MTRSTSGILRREGTAERRRESEQRVFRQPARSFATTVTACCGSAGRLLLSRSLAAAIRLPPVEWLQIITLALIQGITEFLPVSSSAHLILPSQLLGWPDQGLDFDVAVHMGTLLAVIVYFRGDLANYAASAGNLLMRRRFDDHAEELAKIALATLPIVVVGFLVKDWVETELRSVVVIAATTIGFGLLLAYSDTRSGMRTAATWRDALVIGAMQVLSVIPGTSRSGITITAALLIGLSRTGAARFSFLLSIPTIAGAGLLSAVDLARDESATNWGLLATAAALAGAAAYLCIAAFIRLLERTGLMPYVIYRLALGSVLLALWFGVWR
jgi:undecaprenyl-diphosphatase